MSNLTPKQETFCQKYIELGNASEAYRQSYNAENMSAEAIHEEAYRLTKNPGVALRLSALREEHAIRHAVTVDSLTAELEQARLLAAQEKQTATMVSATMGKAKLHGKITDKNEHTGNMTINWPLGRTTLDD